MAARALTAAAVRAAAAELADPVVAENSARFFQARPGGYGEGDEFLGLRVPQQRAVAKDFRGIGRDAVVELLDSPVHEHRLIALMLLTAEIGRVRKNADDAEELSWLRVYLEAVRRGRVNNWDLVDSSAHQILGEHCRRRGEVDLIMNHAAEGDLWRRRVGIIATFAFIRNGDPSALLAVAPLVRDDHRDLIQKAFGWMLRETGKRVDAQILVDYLEANAAAMGRTALSYAIEHRSPDEGRHFRSLR